MLDTNVLVSAYSWKGNEERVVSRCESKELQSITSQDIMDELGVVLVDKFEEPVIDVIRYIERIIFSTWKNAKLDKVHPLYGLHLDEPGWDAHCPGKEGVL